MMSINFLFMEKSTIYLFYSLLSLIFLFLTLISINTAQSKLVNVDFPLKNCETDDFDVLIVDIPPSRDFVYGLLFEQRDIIRTIASTFFKDGIVTTNDSRVRLASITMHYDFIYNWNFTSKESFSNLMDKKDKTYENLADVYYKEGDSY